MHFYMMCKFFLQSPCPVLRYSSPTDSYWFISQKIVWFSNEKFCCWCRCCCFFVEGMNALCSFYFVNDVKCVHSFILVSLWHLAYEGVLTIRIFSHINTKCSEVWWWWWAKKWLNYPAEFAHAEFLCAFRLLFHS